jgi:hypothetical protein
LSYQSVTTRLLIVERKSEQLYLTDRQTNTSTFNKKKLAMIVEICLKIKYPWRSNYLYMYKAMVDYWVFLGGDNRLINKNMIKTEMFFKINIVLFWQFDIQINDFLFWHFDIQINDFLFWHFDNPFNDFLYVRDCTTNKCERIKHFLFLWQSQSKQFTTDLIIWNTSWQTFLTYWRQCDRCHKYPITDCNLILCPHWSCWPKLRPNLTHTIALHTLNYC